MWEAGDKMKVLVAGATGTIGVPLVRTLVAGGHRVYGLTRDPGKRQLLTVLGAEPVIADGMDRGALLAAVDRLAADAVIHQLTALKKPPAGHRDMARTSALRSAGTAGPAGRWRHHVLDLHRRRRCGHRGRPGARPG
jgi:uncharacterized protein YbjT (DUF2867 family)